MPRTRRRHAFTIVLILIGAAIVYLIGNERVPLWDRDEPRYAQTSRQMLRSGDWVVPRLLDEVRTAKPVLIYWCQASAMRLLGENEFAARLPSAVAMLMTLTVLALVIWRAVGPRRALWTTLILASSGLAIAAAKLCITDAVLLLWVLVAELCLIWIYLNRAPWWTPLLMWLAIALAGLTKGPVVLGILLTTIIALAVLDRVGGGRWGEAIRWWPRTRPLVGVVILALVCGPWIYLVERRAPGFLRTSIWHDVITRARSGLDGHTGPPGYYLASIWLTYFPWSLLLPAAAVFAWSRRRSAVHRFCLAAVIGPWLMFELVQTKLVHYLLPVFPPLAFLTADMLIGAARRKQSGLSSRNFAIVVRAWTVVVGAGGLLPWVSLRYFDLPRVAIAGMVLISLLCAGYGLAVRRPFVAGRPLAAAAVMGGGMMLVISVLFGAYLSYAPFLTTSQRVAQVLRDEGAVDPGDAIMIDYREDSLAFYHGGTIRPVQDRSYLINTARSEWPRWVVMTDPVWRATLAGVRAEFDEVARVRGWWYVKGRIVEGIVLRKRTPFALLTASSCTPRQGARRAPRTRRRGRRSTSPARRPLRATCGLHCDPCSDTCPGPATRPRSPAPAAAARAGDLGPSAPRRPAWSRSANRRRTSRAASARPWRRS
jgi:4-amino-4-deoxy-L-arabinose transferase-like glycosyltransferase